MTRRLDKPPTLDEWLEWQTTASRNWTDDPIGTHTTGRRNIDASHSRIFDDVTPINPRLTRQEPAA